MSARVTLPEKLGSAHVAVLEDLLSESAGEDVSLDGSAVRMIGALAAERLVRHAELLTANGFVLQIDPSPEMRADLATLGLEDRLLPEEAHQ